MQRRPLREQEGASEYLRGRGVKVGPNYLAKLRTVGGGPLYRKFGRRVLYDDLDLDAWVDEKLGPPLRSTSEGDPERERLEPRSRPRIQLAAARGAQGE
jgi:hypothetical protein